MRPSGLLQIMISLTVACAPAPELTSDPVLAGGAGAGSQPAAQPASAAVGGGIDADSAHSVESRAAAGATPLSAAATMPPTVGVPVAAPEPALHVPAACSDKITPGDHDSLLEYAGLSRSYRIHVPPGYDGRAPIPLVLSMHGLSMDGVTQQLFDAFGSVADEHRFAIVYPTSDSGSWNAGGCCNPSGPDDVAFMRLVIDKTRERLCVDPTRIYATGMSNGALMSQKLACEAADLFAAVAPVAGPLILPPEQCNPVRPISVMAVAGTNDTLLGYTDGGYLPLISTPGTIVPSAPDSAAGWARRNACATGPSSPTSKSEWPAEPVSGGLAPGGGGWIPDEFARMSAPPTPGASCEWYRDCAAGADVGLCTHDGGHDWPSGTSAAIWNFFERHALP